MDKRKLVALGLELEALREALSPEVCEPSTGAKLDQHCRSSSSNRTRFSPWPLPLLPSGAKILRLNPIGSSGACARGASASARSILRHRRSRGSGQFARRWARLFSGDKLRNRAGGGQLTPAPRRKLVQRARELMQPSAQLRSRWRRKMMRPPPHASNAHVKWPNASSPSNANVTHRVHLPDNAMAQQSVPGPLCPEEVGRRPGGSAGGKALAKREVRPDLQSRPLPLGARHWVQMRPARRSQTNFRCLKGTKQHPHTQINYHSQLASCSAASGREDIAHARGDDCALESTLRSGRCQ